MMVVCLIVLLCFVGCSFFFFFYKQKKKRFLGERNYFFNFLFWKVNFLIMSESDIIVFFFHPKFCIIL